MADMRERLIELINEEYDLFCDECGAYKGGDNIDILADHLIENGVIVLPCNVGDTVYEVIELPNNKQHRIQGVVCAIHIADGLPNSCNHKRSSYMLVECPNTKYVKSYPLSKFGKTIFLTKEEAEQELKEREE